jgi:hypothetical protein
MVLPSSSTTSPPKIVGSICEGIAYINIKSHKEWGLKSTNLIGNFQRFPSTHVLRLGNCRLDFGPGLGVQLLQNPTFHQLPTHLGIGHGRSHTLAEVITTSTSPLYALIKVSNFPITLATRFKRLFSARTSSKFLTATSFSIFFVISRTIKVLSSALSIGDARTVSSLRSRARIALSDLRAVSVDSRVAILADAVYCPFFIFLC